MDLEPGLLRRLLDATMAAIIATDVDERIVYWSRAAEELYGYRSEDIVGRRLREALVLPEHDAIAARIGARVAAGQTWTGSFPVRHRSGAQLTVQISTAPYFDSVGRLAGVVSVSLDITDRVRASEALRREQVLLQSTIDGAPIVLFAVDPSGTFTLSRGSGLSSLRLRENEVVGRSALEMYRDLVVSFEGQTITFPEAFARVMTGESMSAQTVADAAHFDLWLQPACDDAGTITGLIGVALDVTERTELEDRLRQAERLEALGLLAGGVAHDFNNILTAILGHAEILAADLDKDHLREDVDAIRHAARSAAAVTGQLLAFTRRQRQELRLIDVNAVIRTLERLLRRAIGERITLDLDLMPEPAMILADATQIEQVVVNLVLNARDSMPDGGRLRISISLAGAEGGSGDDHIALTVADTGHGMSEATRARIFEPFFTTKQRDRGTGLGLSSVHGIVMQTGGRIVVESQEGAGSTFRVLLPRALGAAPRPAVRLAPAAGRRSSRKTILLVEDEENVRTLIATMLERAGYDVTPHANGTAALAAMREQPDAYDLVLSDVVMPGMNGPDMARAIAAVRPGIPIVFMSGYVQADMVAPADQPALQKPFTRAQLLACLAGRFER